ncbi:hypothetical protein [Ruegeria sp.]|uniref:hypothetical protein n=1 Tax=Ruegeria sp. TaxID=1879320 RepID=UPI003C7C2E45
MGEFMKCSFLAIVCSFGMIPVAAASETYKESFECTFGRGIVNKPTPTRLVFSVDEFGRSVLLHEVEIPDIDTNPGSGRIKRDSSKQLSIEWIGQDYVYSDTGHSYASNESRIDAIDLLNHEFSVLLNRKTMKAIAKSASSSSYLPRDGFAKGRCIQISDTKNK